MARIPEHGAAGTATSGHRPAQEQRAPQPEAAAVVLTPEGRQQLAARAAWLANERIPKLAESRDDPDSGVWAEEEYERAVAELSRLNSVLEQATTTDQLPPEKPGVVELGDEVVIKFADDTEDTERFLVVDPVEAPLDERRISIHSPLAQALLGRRVGEQVDVEAPAGRYRCRIVDTRRHRAAAASPGAAPGGGR